MRRMLKFEIPPAGITLETEDRPTYRAVGWQGDKLVVWLEATPGKGYYFGVIPIMTGDPVPEPEVDAEYIGTAQRSTIGGGPLVLHVYGQR